MIVYHFFSWLFWLILSYLAVLPALVGVLEPVVYCIFKAGYHAQKVRDFKVIG